jgi:DNA-binding transcriptional ArsR family regulator
MTPPARRPADGAGPENDALELVLGPVRAKILRASAKPLPIGWLARILHCAPNTVTYHCDQLEGAGLIARERRGPSVLIGRTQRGHKIVELLLT